MIRKDATLREITDLIKEVNNQARNRNARLSFTLVYPDKLGKSVMRDMGIVFGNPRYGNKDDNKTLDELRFEIGDFIDVSITTHYY